MGNYIDVRRLENLTGGNAGHPERQLECRAAAAIGLTPATAIVAAVPVEKGPLFRLIRVLLNPDRHCICGMNLGCVGVGMVGAINAGDADDNRHGVVVARRGYKGSHESL